MPNLQARAMRRLPTNCERLRWSRLRDRRLDGVKFRRQHPIGPFIADFACVEGKLVVEVDGGQHVESDYDAFSIEVAAGPRMTRRAVLEQRGVGESGRHSAGDPAAATGTEPRGMNEKKFGVTRSPSPSALSRLDLPRAAGEVFLPPHLPVQRMDEPTRARRHQEHHRDQQHAVHRPRC
jgi:Protein of unknown function (DUF559)